MKRIRARVHELTSASHSGQRDVKRMIASLNPALRGWGNYFRTGNADDKFNHIDSYVHERICHWLQRRGGQRSIIRLQHWPQQRLYDMGLHRRQGSVVYPAHATPVRLSLSRVREIRTHGLKGDIGTGSF